MTTRAHKPEKAPQNSTSTPVNSQFQSRPFAVQAESQNQEKPDLQTQLENAKSFGHNFANISISSPSSSTPPLIQPKLTIGEPGDKYEQEADKTAAEVVQRIHAPIPSHGRDMSQPPSEFAQRMRANVMSIPSHGRDMSQPPSEFAQRMRANVVQRSGSISQQGMLTNEQKLMKKPEEEALQREAMPEEEGELQMKPMLQRQSSEGEMDATPSLEASIQRLRGSGQPLADTIREPMEQAFGADFSRVKIHTDAQSDQLNQSIQAKAFTTGQDVFFRQGAYEPGSRGGQELIAHELTHVVQQSGSGKVQRTKAPQPINKEIASVGIAEEKIQRITDDEEQGFEEKYGKMWGSIQNGLIRITQLQGKEYDSYKKDTSKEEFQKACESINQTEGKLTKDAKKEMAKDIVVPQSYYHVTKSFDKISGLVTTGAATCTGLALSSSNEKGEPIYALTHIDDDNDIPKMIDGMMADMEAQNSGIVGAIDAYIASGSVKPQGDMIHTPKKVVEYLKSKGVAIQFTSAMDQIRIGGNSKKGDLVRTGQDVDNLHKTSGQKDADALIKQATALTQMKGGHGKWEKLADNAEYKATIHDPMEDAINQVLQRGLILEKNTPVNDEEQQQKLKALKTEINTQKNWFENYSYGKRILKWAESN